VLQRKCACGGSSGLSGECDHCQKNKLLGTPLQPKLTISEPGDPFEQEADRMAEQVMRMPDDGSRGLIGEPVHVVGESVARMSGLQRAEGSGADGGPPSDGAKPEKEPSRCPSWRADPESISKRAGEFYARNHLTPASQATVERIECEPPVANGNYGCYVHFSDGLVLRVIVRGMDIVVGTGPGPITTLRPPPATPLCFYEYSCPEGDLVLTVKQCLSAKPSQSSGPPAVAQRAAASRAPGPAAAPPIVHDVLAQSGQPLDASTRAFFEPRFGFDFSHVRIHADAKASESAHAVDALAYTVGQDIVFRNRQFDPQSPAGRRLLAHELSHVIQQEGRVLGRMLRRAPAPAPSSEVEENSLESGLAATHDVIVGGERFNLAVMTAQSPPDDPSAKYRKAAEQYLGDYPNLGGGLWAFLVRPSDGLHCSIGGNCLGWALGTFGLNDPPQWVWAKTQAYLDSIGRPVRAHQTPLEAYLTLLSKEKIPASAIWDYFMETEFQAVPTERDGDAHLALYGRGLSGSMDGPSHIAFRTAGGELWVSKPSPIKFPFVHERAAQMAGGETGEIVRLYKAASGPPGHVVLLAKQAKGSAQP
jgi:hypothetical protein